MMMNAMTEKEELAATQLFRIVAEELNKSPGQDRMEYVLRRAAEIVLEFPSSKLARVVRSKIELPTIPENVEVMK